MVDITITPLDEEKLFETRVFQDGIAGSLILRIPKNFDGDTVVSREREYIGQTQVYVNKQPIGVQFPIPNVKSLREAFQAWPTLAHAACTKVVEDLQSQALRSAILTPGKKGQ